MSTAINRMQFLRGDIAGKHTPIRPPWSVTEALFTNVCNSCGECISHCPTHIIEEGRGGFPIINFKKGECLFCEECVDACQPHALLKSESKPAWSVTATIDTKKCMAQNNIECRTCYDPCESQSINMTPRIGGVSIPIINSTTCTGCGACFAICPTNAISMNNT